MHKKSFFLIITALQKYFHSNIFAYFLIELGQLYDLK